jgi:type II secretory pathway pseudopilin PulG
VAILVDYRCERAVYMKNRTAYSLTELIVIVAVIAVMALIAVPRLQFAALHGQQADTVARKIVTDLRRTRRLAISNAATNSKGFELIMVPPAPYATYEIEDGDTHTVVDSQSIPSDIAVTCSGSHEFRFGPLGNLKSGSGTDLAVSAEEKSFTITVDPATGMITCTED